MVNYNVFFPTYLSLTNLTFFLGKLFIPNEFKSIFLLYENNTIPIVKNFLLTSHLYQTPNHRWTMINLDNPIDLVMLKYLQNLNIDDVFAFTVINYDYFYFLIDGTFTNAAYKLRFFTETLTKVNFPNLIITLNNKPNENEKFLSDLMLVTVFNQYRIVLFVLMKDFYRIYILNEYLNKTDRFNNSIIYDNTINLYDALFSDKSKNMQNEILTIEGFFNPPRIMFLQNKNGSKKGIGGSLGSICSLLGHYFNATIVFQTRELWIKNKSLRHFYNKNVLKPFYSEHFTPVNIFTF